MDATAFEGAADDSFSLVDVLSSLRWPAQFIVHHVLLVFAGIGCIATLLYMLGWIIFFWLSVHFLRLFARLLGVVFEERVQLEGCTRPVVEVIPPTELVVQDQRDGSTRSAICDETFPRMVPSNEFCDTDMGLVDEHELSTIENPKQNSVENISEGPLKGQDSPSGNEFAHLDGGETHRQDGNFVESIDVGDTKGHHLRLNDPAFRVFGKDEHIPSEEFWGHIIHGASVSEGETPKEDCEAFLKEGSHIRSPDGFEDEAAIQQKADAQRRAGRQVSAEVLLLPQYNTRVREDNKHPNAPNGQYSADQLAEAVAFSRDATRGKYCGAGRRAGLTESISSEASRRTVRLATWPGFLPNSSKRCLGKCKLVKPMLHFLRMGESLDRKTGERIYLNTCADCRGLEVDAAMGIVRRHKPVYHPNLAPRDVVADPDFVPPHLRKRAEAKALKEQPAEVAVPRPRIETSLDNRVPAQHHSNISDEDIFALTKLTPQRSDVAADVEQQVQSVSAVLKDKPQRSASQSLETTVAGTTGDTYSKCGYQIGKVSSPLASLPRSDAAESARCEVFTSETPAVIDYESSSSEPPAHIMTAKRLKMLRPTADPSELLTTTLNDTVEEAGLGKTKGNRVQQCLMCARWEVVEAPDSSSLCKCCASVDLALIKRWNSIIKPDPAQQPLADSIGRLEKRHTEKFVEAISSSNEPHGVDALQQNRVQSAKSDRPPKMPHVKSPAHHEGTNLASVGLEDITSSSVSKFLSNTEQRQAIIKQIKKGAAEKVDKGRKSEPQNLVISSSDPKHLLAVSDARPNRTSPGSPEHQHPGLVRLDHALQSLGYQHPDLIGLDFLPPQNALQPSAGKISSTLAPQATPFFPPRSKSSNPTASVPFQSSPHANRFAPQSCSGASQISDTALSTLPARKPSGFHVPPHYSMSDLAKSIQTSAKYELQSPLLAASQAVFDPIHDIRPAPYPSLGQGNLTNLPGITYSDCTPRLLDCQALTYAHPTSFETQSGIYDALPSTYGTSSDSYVGNGPQWPISVPLSAPGSITMQKTRRSTASKAVAIIKPLEMVYDENVPALPGPTLDRPSSRLGPPPGLGDVVEECQNTCDALPSKKDISRGSAQFSHAESDSVRQHPTCSMRQGDEILKENLSDCSIERRDIEEDKSLSATNSAISIFGRVPECSSTATVKKKRRSARRALNEAWHQREQIRTRVSATYTLNGIRALEDKTQAYNQCRDILAGHMAEKRLSKEDEKFYPSLAKQDLSRPKVKPPHIAIANFDEDGFYDLDTKQLWKSNDESEKADRDAVVH